jgi:hypothetical protein
MDEQLLARIYAKVAEIEAMKVANREREIKGFAFTYSEESFFGVAKELEQLGGIA